MSEGEDVAWGALGFYVQVVRRREYVVFQPISCRPDLKFPRPTRPSVPAYPPVCHLVLLLSLFPRSLTIHLFSPTCLPSIPRHQCLPTQEIIGMDPCPCLLCTPLLPCSSSSPWPSRSRHFFSLPSSLVLSFSCSCPHPNSFLCNMFIVSRLLPTKRTIPSFVDTIH